MVDPLWENTTRQKAAADQMGVDMELLFFVGNYGMGRRRFCVAVIATDASRWDYAVTALRLVGNFQTYFPLVL